MENSAEKEKAAVWRKLGAQMDSEDVKCAAEIACEVVRSHSSKNNQQHTKANFHSKILWHKSDYSKAAILVAPFRRW